MAKGTKTGGKDFEKGHLGGPGRPPLPGDIKEAPKLNLDELERVLNRFLYMTRAELQDVVKAPETPLIDALVGSIVARAIQGGDHARLDFILNRLVGRVQEKLEVSTPEPFIIRRLDGSTVVMGVKAPSEA